MPDTTNNKDLSGIVLFITQLVVTLTPFFPLIRLSLSALTKFLKSASLSSILFKMRTFKGRSCKLRYMAYSTADVIINLIQHAPQGYSFWSLLPRRGRGNKDALRKAIADTLLSSFYDDHFISILLKGALDDKGKPLGDSTLYHWLLSNVYSDSAQALYSDWLRVSKRAVEQHCE